MRTEIQFSEPSGSGRVVLTSAGRRIRVGIDKECRESARTMVVHAAITPEDAATLRDGLTQWLDVIASMEPTS